MCYLGNNTVEKRHNIRVYCLSKLNERVISLADGRGEVVLHIGVRTNAYNDHPQGRIQLLRMILSPLRMVGLSPQQMQI